MEGKSSHLCSTSHCLKNKLKFLNLNLICYSRSFIFLNCTARPLICPPEATRGRLIPETGENELIQNVSFVFGIWKKWSRNLPKIPKFLELPIWRNKLYQIVTWSKSFEVPWNNVNVPLVVQNKDNIFTSSVIRSQKYWYFTINSLVRFAHSFVYLVKYQYFCSLIPSVVKILSLFFTTRGTLLQYCGH